MLLYSIQFLRHTLIGMAAFRSLAEDPGVECDRSQTMMMIYRSCAKSLGAAHAVAQWARWKTTIPYQFRHLFGSTSVLLLYSHSSTQSSWALPCCSWCEVTRSTQWSKWCLAGAHSAELAHSAYQSQPSDTNITEA